MGTDRRAFKWPDSPTTRPEQVGYSSGGGRMFSIGMSRIAAEYTEKATKLLDRALNESSEAANDIVGNFAELIKTFQTISDMGGGFGQYWSRDSLFSIWQYVKWSHEDGPATGCLRTADNTTLDDSQIEKFLQFFAKENREQVKSDLAEISIIATDTTPSMDL
ncbi:MAG: hypothetical protein JXR42_04295 [Gammaproteobacteria bacterium]|nr:hypothetical protein [Gammaproteobacteria bacterium]